MKLRYRFVLAIALASAVWTPAPAQSVSGQTRTQRTMTIPSSPILPMSSPILPMRNPVSAAVPSPHLPYPGTNSIPVRVEPPAPQDPNVVIPFFPVYVEVPSYRRERKPEVLIREVEVSRPTYVFIQESPRRDYLVPLPEPGFFLPAQPEVTPQSPNLTVAPPPTTPAPQISTPPPAPLPGPGTSRAEVIRQLGTPIGTLGTAKTETLYFEDGRAVVLQNGAVIEGR